MHLPLSLCAAINNARLTHSKHFKWFSNCALKWKPQWAIYSKHCYARIPFCSMIFKRKRRATLREHWVSFIYIESKRYLPLISMHVTLESFLLLTFFWSFLLSMSTSSFCRIMLGEKIRAFQALVFEGKLDTFFTTFDNLLEMSPHLSDDSFFPNHSENRLTFSFSKLCKSVFI